MAKVLIDIPDDVYTRIKQHISKEQNGVVPLLEAAIAHGTVIPDVATNGDVIEALYPATPDGVRINVTQIRSDYQEMCFTTDSYWWEAPYYKEKKCTSKNSKEST